MRIVRPPAGAIPKGAATVWKNRSLRSRLGNAPADAGLNGMRPGSATEPRPEGAVMAVFEAAGKGTIACAS